MAAPKKKVVTKDTLRRFMKEQQTASKSTSKRIDHPLAKYNSLNQLVCVLCNHVIKNDLLWQAHILSKPHKEKVVALKTQGPAKPQSLSEPAVKRKADSIPENISTEKKQKTDHISTDKSKHLPSDFFDDAARNERRERAKAALLAGYSSSEDDSDEKDEEEETEVSGKSKRMNSSPDEKASRAATERGLPADFFDEGHEPSTSEDAGKSESSNKKMSEVLPEGFFDDPKMDAKVRNVEYKDKMEEEWDLFQRAMKEEAQVSEVIMEEEDEQVNIDRNIDEIDDQIHRWQEVENLHIKKETVLKNVKEEGQKNEESGDELEEEDLDQFLDWRAKKVIT